MKKTILTLCLAICSTLIFAQKSDFQLSSHILDISKGMPASGVPIKLERYEEEGSWLFVDQKITDENGRIKDFLSSKTTNLGIYKLTYFTHDYFEKDGIKSFYPFIEVVFEIKDNSHYHVPITLSAFGYSTYRGN